MHIAPVSLGALGALGVRTVTSVPGRPPPLPDCHPRGGTVCAWGANAVIRPPYICHRRPLLPIQQFRCGEWALAASREAERLAMSGGGLALHSRRGGAHRMAPNLAPPRRLVQHVIKASKDGLVRSGDDSARNHRSSRSVHALGQLERSQYRALGAINALEGSKPRPDRAKMLTLCGAPEGS